MIHVNVGDIRGSLKQGLVLESCRNQNKDIIILTESHINHDKIHHIRNNWLDAIFFPPGEIHTE